MGSLDDARGAAAGFKQQTEQNISALQGAGQNIAEAQQAFRGALGNTSNPKVLDVEARCQDAKQKVADAITALNAALQAAEQFSAGLN